MRNGSASDIARFGRVRLDMRRRELLVDGVSVALGRRALEVLVMLVEARGELVTKDVMLSRIWPGTAVEENVLQSQISIVRKVLGEDRDCIRTVSGRGYRFVGTVTDEAAHRDAAFVASDLSPPLTELIGRDAHLLQLEALVASYRLVTLVGTGGIGKTRLALETLRRLQPKFADGTSVAQLAQLSDANLVRPVVGAAMGLADGTQPSDSLAAAAASKRLLVILDNCEHMIDTTARLAEELVQASATLRVIATSREPLGVPGEFVYRVPPLDVPPAGSERIEDVLAYDAAKLFAARAQAAGPFLLDARSGAATANICRSLDGIPLAIELAAARAATLGVGTVASLLDDRFNLLTGGQRTAPMRHQTLRAALDWSHELLSDAERIVLRRLAMFPADFTLQAAGVVAAGDDIAAWEVLQCLTTLVSKSLVTLDLGGTRVRYRLLETTRAYAIERLNDSGESEQVAQRYTEYFRHRSDDVGTAHDGAGWTGLSDPYDLRTSTAAPCRAG